MPEGNAKQPERLGEAVAVIERCLHPAAIFLFGSAARGELRSDSDVDIAILTGGPPVDPFRVAGLKTDVEAVLGRAVDLAVLDDASPILCMEVLREHRLLVNHNAGLLQRFVVKTLGAYFDLKRTRRPIEDALRAQAQSRA